MQRKESEALFGFIGIRYIPQLETKVKNSNFKILLEKKKSFDLLSMRFIQRTCLYSVERFHFIHLLILK